MEIAPVFGLGTGQENAGSFQIVAKAIEELSKPAGPYLPEDFGLAKVFQIFHNFVIFESSLAGEVGHPHSNQKFASKEGGNFGWSACGTTHLDFAIGCWFLG